MQQAQPSFGLTAIIYVAVIALFVWRMARPQRVTVVRLWVMPAVLVLLTAFTIWAGAYAAAAAGEAPAPQWEVAAVVAIGAVLGIPLGFLRGRHSEVRPTDRAGVMYVHSSPVIIIVWLAAFAARAIVRALMPHAQSGAAVWSDGLLAFAMAALITSYYAIYKKYRVALQQAPAR